MDQQRWSDPHRSKWVTTAKPTDAVAPKPATRRGRPAPAKHYTNARLAFDAAHIRMPLQSVIETLPLAEQARRSILSICKYLARRTQPILAEADIWPLSPAFW